MTNISLNQLTYDFLNLFRDLVKDSDNLSQRQIRYWIQTTRAKLLKQKFQKPMYIPDEHFVQDLGTVTMEQINGSIYAGLDFGTVLLRSNISIPATIEDIDGLGTLTRVGPINRLNENFNLVRYQRAIWSGNGKFNRDNIYAFILGDRICLYSKSGIHKAIRYINVRGVFQNPIEAALIANPSYTYEDDYPINMEMVDDLKSIILNKEFKVSMLKPSDEIADERNDVLLSKTKGTK